MRIYFAAAAAVVALELIACSPVVRPFDGSDPSLVDGRATAASDASRSFEMASSVEVAKRLARFLWMTEAPVDLEVEIDANRSPAAIGEIATRMLKDARARVAVGAFFRWWLRLDDLPTLLKQDPQGLLTSELRESMRHEGEAMGRFVMLDGDGRIETLFTAPFTFVDEQLARHYAMAGVTGDAMRQVSFDTKDRVGIFGGAGVLTRFASFYQPTWPPKRTWLVDGVALCQSLPTSPAIAEESDPAKPIRSQTIEATAMTSCMGCHHMLNEPGFAFLKFDTYGRYQTGDAGGPLDTRGTMPSEVLADRPQFDGQPDLMRMLSGRTEVRRCMAQAWLQFAMAPNLPHPTLPPDDIAGSIDEIAGAFEASGANLRALPAAVARSEAFLEPTLATWR